MHLEFVQYVFIPLRQHFRETVEIFRANETAAMVPYGFVCTSVKSYLIVHSSLPIRGYATNIYPPRDYFAMAKDVSPCPSILVMDISGDVLNSVYQDYKAQRNTVKAVFSIFSYRMVDVHPKPRNAMLALAAVDEPLLESTPTSSRATILTSTVDAARFLQNPFQWDLSTAVQPALRAETLQQGVRSQGCEAPSKPRGEFTIFVRSHGFIGVLLSLLSSVLSFLLTPISGFATAPTCSRTTPLRKSNRVTPRRVLGVLSSSTLLALLQLLSLPHVSRAAQCKGRISEGEYQALYALFNATNGTHWAWRSTTAAAVGEPWVFNMSFASTTQQGGSGGGDGDSYLSEPCTQPWQGITCGSLSSSSCYVSELNLPAYNLQGRLPVQLGNLSRVFYLYLQSNTLTGSIPSSLSNVVQLHHLSLYANLLTGRIPSSLGSLAQLQYLILHSNSLTGSIPLALQNLTLLQYLDLSSNSLTGSIPSALGHLSRLLQLILASNEFTGPIPTSVGNLVKLEELSLFSNALTGPIPSTLGTLTLLQYLLLYTNSLTGHLATALGNLAKLTEMRISSNALTGCIPTSLGKLAELEYLYLDTNSLTGTIPWELGFLAQLAYLHLYTNFLTGSIPGDLENLPQLRDLRLYMNLLTGTIPSGLGNLAQLEYVYLYTNFLSGIIPPGVGNLFQLKNLYLDGNLLIGSIPSTVGNLVLLENLDVDTNFLTGSIPSSLGNLTQLQYLYLYSNSLTGQLPAALGFLAQLQCLLIHSNSLTGSIPSSLGNLSKLEELNICSNEFTGPIPTFLGNLASLVYLSACTNFLTGPIPASLGDLPKLKYLLLSTNSLTGSVPSSLGKLAQLIVLYLNGNEIDGNMNAFVYSADAGAADEEVNCPLLQEIDISDNAFSGTFPAALFSLPELITLAAANNCFSGLLIINVPNSTHSKLETLLLDGLSSGATCRYYVIPSSQLAPNQPGFVPFNFMVGSVPSLLWSLPRLQTVSLIGNGFVGTLDVGSFDISSRRLQSLSLAYNRLTGSIPLTFQSYGKFDYFDVSNNRFSGGISSNMVFNSTFADAFNVSMKRLSGPFPMNQNSILSSQQVVNTVLLGNMFTLDGSFGDAPVSPAAMMFSGSSQFNIAIAISSVTPIIWILVWFTGRLKAATLHRISALQAARDIVDTWLRYELSNSINTTRVVMVAKSLVHCIAALVVVSIIVGLLIVLLKTTSSIPKQYGLYEWQYAWTFSAAYLHDVAPMVLCCIGLALASILIGTLFFPVHIKPLTTQPVAPLEILSEDSIGGAQNRGQINWRFLKTCLRFSLLWLVNAAVMLALNSLYLTAIRETNPHIVLIQALVALAKYCWSSWFAYVTSTFLASPRWSQFADLCQLSLQIFNFVVAPSVATAIGDRNCFHELFNEPPAQTIAASGQCYSAYDAPAQLDCGATEVEALVQPFSPPFIYGYQCSSALIVNYVPVLLYIFVYSSICAPAAILLSLRYSDTIRRWLPRWVINKMFPRLYRISGHTDTDGASADDSSYAAVISNEAVTSAWLLPFSDQIPFTTTATELAHLLFRGELFMNRLMLHLVVMMTFGLAAPYLALVVCFSLFAELVTMRILVGRYLALSSTAATTTSSSSLSSRPNAAGRPDPRDEDPATDLLSSTNEFGERSVIPVSSDGRAIADHDSATLAGDVEMKYDASVRVPNNRPSPDSSLLEAALKHVDEALGDAWLCPYRGAWLVVIISQLFWAMLFFDMIGDVYGYEAGLQAMLATMLCVPVLTYWIVRASLHRLLPFYDSYAWLQRSDATAVGLSTEQPAEHAGGQSAGEPAGQTAEPEDVVSMRSNSEQIRDVSTVASAEVAFL